MMMSQFYYKNAPAFVLQNRSFSSYTKLLYH